MPAKGNINSPMLAFPEYLRKVSNPTFSGMLELGCRRPEEQWRFDSKRSGQDRISSQITDPQTERERWFKCVMWRRESIGMSAEGIRRRKKRRRRRKEGRRTKGREKEKRRKEKRRKKEKKKKKKNKDVN